MTSTIDMPDSIYPQNMPGGYPAYLAYADGQWVTEAAVRAKFPGAHVLTLTVTGGNTAADGCDRENGDLTAAGAAEWLAWKRAAWPSSRPVLYASRDNVTEVLALAAGRGVTRDRIRILSAHYGDGPHICGGACGAPFEADGTQYTDAFPGNGGALVDMSLLRGDFFGAVTPPAPVTEWTEFDAMKLRVLKLGDADAPGTFWAVRRLQTLLNLTARLNDITNAAFPLACDGVMGPLSVQGLKAVQAHAGIAADGIAGPQVWGVLLTGSPQ